MLQLSLSASSAYDHRGAYLVLYVVLPTSEHSQQGAAQEVAEQPPKGQVRCHRGFDSRWIQVQKLQDGQKRTVPVMNQTYS